LDAARVSPRRGTPEIAARLYIAAKTVRTHLSNVLAKQRGRRDESRVISGNRRVGTVAGVELVSLDRQRAGCSGRWLGG
jgi:hypothetical protein